MPQQYSIRHTTASIETVTAHDSAISSIAVCASKFFKTAVDEKIYGLNRYLRDGSTLLRVRLESGAIKTVKISLCVNDGEPIPWVKMSNNGGSVMAAWTAWRNPKFDISTLGPSAYHEIAIIMNKVDISFITAAATS